MMEKIDGGKVKLEFAVTLRTGKVIYIGRTVKYPTRTHIVKFLGFRWTKKVEVTKDWFIKYDENVKANLSDHKIVKRKWRKYKVSLKNV